MKDNSIEVGKAAGIWTYIYAILDWFTGIPLDSWATFLAIVGGICMITAYLFDIHKKRLEIRLLSQQLESEHEHEK